MPLWWQVYVVVNAVIMLICLGFLMFKWDSFTKSYEAWVRAKRNKRYF